MKICIFDDSFHKKGQIGHFDAIDDQTIRIRKFFEELGLLRPVRLQRLLRSMRLERFLRPGKSLLWTSVFKVLEFNNFRTNITLF